MVKFLIIILLVFYLIVESIIYKKMKILVSAGFLNSLLWVLMLVAFLIFDDEVTPYYGIVYIMICIIIFSLAFRLGHSFRINNKLRTPILVFSLDKLKKYILLFGSLETVIYGAVYIKSGGVQNAANVAYEYYTTVTEMSALESLFNQVNSLLLFSTALFAGLYSNLEKKRYMKLIAAMAFFPPIIGMLTSSGKLGLINAIIFFFVGYFIGAVYSGNTIDFGFYTGMLKKYWKYFLAVGVLLFASFLIRYGSASAEYIDIAGHRMIVYAFGSPAGFNYWFATRKDSSLFWGGYTFTSIAKIFGWQQEKGVYSELVNSEIWETNVYTAFRAIIMDFGIVGGLLFTCFGGLFLGMARKHYVYKHSLLSAIVMGMGYLFILFSVFNSPYVYMNMTLAIPFSIIISYMFLSKRKNYIGPDGAL